MGGQVEAVTASAMALRTQHLEDASIPVAAVQLLLSGTRGGSAGQEEEEAALGLAHDENLMMFLSKARLLCLKSDMNESIANALLKTLSTEPFSTFLICPKPCSIRTKQWTSSRVNYTHEPKMTFNPCMLSTHATL